MNDQPHGHPDSIEAAGSSTRLFGASIEYRYSTGNHYRLLFDREFHVTFEFLGEAAGPSSAADAQGPVLSYRAKEIRPDLILVHWIVKDAAIHVSLTIDLERHQIHSAAMMPPNRYEFWDTATIIAFEPGSGADNAGSSE